MRRTTITGPVILILLGLLFLASNYNLVPVDIWSRLGHFWPIILILLGIELLTGRDDSSGVRLLGRLLVLATIFGVLALAWMGIGVGAATVPGGVRQDIRVPLDGATSATMQVNGTVGPFDLGAAKSASATDPLVTGVVTSARARRIQPDVKRSGSHLEVTIGGGENNSVNIVNPFEWRSFEEQWTLALNPNVPIDLSFEGGVGSSTLDLTDLRVSRLKLSGGVGPARITLPRRGQVSADVNGGVGSLDLVVPDGVAAQINLNRGLGGLSVAGRFRAHGDDSFESEGYATAADRVQLSIDGGVGSVNVR